MKYTLIGAAILLILGIAGMMAFNTEIENQKEIVVQQSARIHELETQLYYTCLPREKWISPIRQYWLSSDTGYRTDPMGGGEDRLHKGVDLTAPRGTKIVAILDGVVVEHWPAPDGYWEGHPVFGGYIVIEHHGFYSLYGHLSETFVHQGDVVAAGQVIGIIGNTGISTGRHLHFEVIVNPFDYLAQR